MIIISYVFSKFNYKTVTKRLQFGNKKAAAKTVALKVSQSLEYSELAYNGKLFSLACGSVNDTDYHKSQCACTEQE